MNKIFPGLALFLLAIPNTGAAAAGTPLYRTALPAQICAPGSALHKSYETCERNGGFVKSAQECWANLEEMQKRVTHDLEQRIGKPAANRQNESFGVSSATYAEGIAAHEYMFNATQQAQKELDEYFDFLVYPEEAESEKDVFAEPCYMDSATALDDTAEKFQEKLVALAGKLEATEELKNESSTNKTQTGAVNGVPVAVKGGKQGTSAPSAAASKAGGKKPGGNTITGVEQDKQKRQK